MWAALLKRAVGALAFVGVCVLLLWLVWPKKIQTVDFNSDAVALESIVPEKDKVDVVIPPGKPPRAAKKTEKLKKQTRLPEQVFEDPTKNILAASKFNAKHEGVYDVSAVYDSPTGNTSIHVAAEPLPWLGFPNKARIGAGYNAVQGTGQLRFMYDAVRSKKFLLTGEAVLRESGKHDATIYLDYTF